MGSIRKQIELATNADAAWDAVRDFGAAHERLAPGFVTATEHDGRDRIVTFASGNAQREPLVSLDDETRRLVYSAVASPMGATHYNAAIEVLDTGNDGSTLVWTVDYLPDSITQLLENAMQAGVQIMKKTLEA